MNGDFSFGNFENVDHNDNFAPVAAGEYDFRILTPELTPTRAGDGQIVNIKLQVHGGPNDGRMVFARFNVANPNPTAVEIALKQLKQMFMSCGINAVGEITWSQIQATEGRICRALIYIKKDAEHGDKNEIRRFITPEIQNTQQGGQNHQQVNQNTVNNNQQQVNHNQNTVNNNQNQAGNNQNQPNNNQNQVNHNQQGGQMPWQQQ